jgi:hypothetical protein
MRRNPTDPSNLLLVAIFGAWAWAAAGSGLFGPSAQSAVASVNAKLRSFGALGPSPAGGALPSPHYLQAAAAQQYREPRLGL